MQTRLTAEIRWFWRDLAPPGLHEWFTAAESSPMASTPSIRTDHYLLTLTRPELGVKRRGPSESLECKACVAAGHAEVEVDPFHGPIELWTKWQLDLPAPEAPVLTIRKERWQRAFDTAPPEPLEIDLDRCASFPRRGCRIELTLLELPDVALWWTLAFEAVGSPRTIEEDLRRSAAALARRIPPGLGAPIRASVPEWITRHLAPDRSNDS